MSVDLHWPYSNQQGGILMSIILLQQNRLHGEKEKDVIFLILITATFLNFVQDLISTVIGKELQ
jgi:hypothetical protein